MVKPGPRHLQGEIGKVRACHHPSHCLVLFVPLEERGAPVPCLQLPRAPSVPCLCLSCSFLALSWPLLLTTWSMGFLFWLVDLLVWFSEIESL